MSGFTRYTNEFLQEIPEMDPEYLAELTSVESNRSLDVESDRPHLVKIYEKLAILTPNAPYFNARLGELFWKMGSVPLAAVYFKKAQAQLDDLLFEDEPSDPQLKENVAMAKRETTLNLLNISQLRVDYSQPWKESVAHRFPEDLVFPAEHEDIKGRWTSLSPASRQRAFELMAMDTNELERTFLLTEESKRDLVSRGIDAGTIDPQPESNIKDEGKILSILHDTLAAFEILQDILSLKKQVNKTTIEEMHARVMYNARFLENNGYLASGVTRDVTQQTVVIGTAAGPIQCCPYEKIPRELAYICSALQEHMSKQRNSFAIASWLHLVFARCHPFEDGNGRVTRILASYPLVKQGYPLISVARKDSAAYFSAINRAYEGDHEPLIACFFAGMKDVLDTVQTIQTEQL